MIQTSKRWDIDRNDGIHALKVFGWSAAASFVAFLIALIPSINVPTEYVLLVPVVNAALVALQRFIANNK